MFGKKAGRQGVGRITGRQACRLLSRAMASVSLNDRAGVRALAKTRRFLATAGGVGLFYKQRVSMSGQKWDAIERSA